MKIPEKAEREIWARLSSELSISSDEVAEILRKNHVKQDEAVLQRSYRKRVGQQYLAGFRDADGKREILAAPNGKGGMDYVVVDGCNDPQKLQHIQRRLQRQMNGLSGSELKVHGRLWIMRHFWGQRL